MNNTTKAGASLVGGGVIVGGSIAVDKYLLDNESRGEDESYAPYILPVADTSVSIDTGKTVEKVLQEMGLNVASTESEFKTIHSNIRANGVPSWFSSVKINYGNTKSEHSDMQKQCRTQLNKNYSEFKDNPRSDKFKAIKLFCTTNYTLIENAKDYLEDGNYIHSGDQNLDTDKWSDKLKAFKDKAGNGDKTIDDMKTECLRIGGTLYSAYKANVHGDFYKFCVIDNTNG